MGITADGNFGYDFEGGGIDDGDGVILFGKDEERFTGRVLREECGGEGKG